jgi:hypothetical protein
MDEKKSAISTYGYIYAEFVDHVSKAGLSARKDGSLMLVGEADEELIRDFNLKKGENGHYLTSFSDIGETSWRLKFVTPCGYGAGGHGGGAMENSYIFEKAVEYVDFDW